MGLCESRAAKDFDDLPVELDGWYNSHESIRYAERNILKALDVIRREADSGQLETWKIDNFVTFWHQFEDQVHTHHDHEENLFFPWIETRAKLPPKMSSDHATLLELMATTTKAISQLQEASSSERAQAAAQCIQNMQALQLHMDEHLKEEEDQGIPIVRDNFTWAEYQAVENKVVKEAQWFELPQLLMYMENDKKYEWMTTHGIPSFVQYLIIRPRIARFETECLAPFRAIYDTA